MLKKTIKFDDFDENEVTEDHYFHLSKSELIDMELTEDGGMAAKLEAISERANGAEIINTFKWIIGKAYGQRDPVVPTKFVKSEKITDEFMNSLAFDALFSELMTDPEAAAEFVNGLMPKDMRSDPKVQKAMAGARTIKDVDLSRGSIGVHPDAEQAALIKAQEDERTGLKNPRNKAGELVPWAYRNPTSREQTIMSKAQLVDAMGRQSSGWLAPFND